MARKSKSPAPEQEPNRYAAPALEKGLDILELLAGQGSALGQSEVARALGRTPAEIFRMLNCLERRGYLERSPQDERYRLSSRLFELAHHHPPTRLLLDVALPIMRELAREVDQSCHLSIRHDDQALVVAQVDGPGFIGFAVRVGSRAPLFDSCSGRVLLAFGEFDPEGDLPAEVGQAARTKLRGRLATICERGYEETESTRVRGITDVGAPVLGHGGRALASLTVPCLTPMGAAPAHGEVRDAVREAAERIGTALGGRSPVE